MYEKEINLIDLYLPQKIASRKCVLRGSKMLKIDYSGGWRGGPMSLAMAQDFWTAGPLPHGSKIPK